MDIQTITTIVGIIIASLYFGGLARVMWYEKKINQLHAELEEKIEYERSQPQSMVSINGRIDRWKMIYEPKISELERKRRFILDKLPFVRN
mgnify:CR=1 FL=1